MFKKTFLGLVCFCFLLSSATFAGSLTDNSIVKLDEKTFVLVKNLATGNESISSVLALFKVEGDQLVLKDEVHYEGAIQLSLRSKNERPSVIHHDPPAQ